MCGWVGAGKHIESLGTTLHCTALACDRLHIKLRYRTQTIGTTPSFGLMSRVPMSAFGLTPARWSCSPASLRTSQSSPGYREYCSQPRWCIDAWGSTIIVSRTSCTSWLVAMLQACKVHAVTLTVWVWRCRRYLIRHTLPPRLSESEILLQLAWTYEQQSLAEGSGMHATLSLKAYEVRLLAHSAPVLQ